jgi:hypothetical protein
MSETEKLFYTLQEKLGGNAQWGDIPTFYQYEFVAAINKIIQIASAVKPENQ